MPFAALPSPRTGEEMGAVVQLSDDRLRAYHPPGGRGGGWIAQRPSLGT